MKNIAIVFLRVFILFSLLRPFHACQIEEQSTIQEAETKESLFNRDEALTLSLNFDVDFFKEANEGKRYYHKALFMLETADGRMQKISAEVKLRGQFRTDTAYCTLPQLKLKLDKALMGIKSFDLVLPCQDNPEYTQYLVLENLIYQFYQRFCEFSFQCKMVKLQIQNTGKSGGSIQVYAMLKETENTLEQRCQAKELETLPIDSSRIDPLVYHKMLIFQQLIGNDDWSLRFLHNIKILENENGSLFPLPYDFDFAEMISTPYASFDTVELYENYPLQKNVPMYDYTLGVLSEHFKYFITMTEQDALLTAKSKMRTINYLKKSMARLKENENR